MPEPAFFDADAARQVGGWAAALITAASALYATVRMRAGDKRSDEKSLEIDLFYKGLTDRNRDLERRIDDMNDKMTKVLSAQAEEKILAVQEAAALSNKIQTLQDEIDELRMSNAMLKSEVDGLKASEANLVAENNKLKRDTDNPRRRHSDPPHQDWGVTGG